MNRKETMLMTIVGMAILTTVTTMSSSTQALALGHWNIDEDYIPNNGFAEDSMDSSRTSDSSNGDDEDNEEDSTAATDEDDEEDSNDDSSGKEDSSNAADLQACPSDAEGPEGDGSLTKEQMQDCESASDKSASTESTDDDGDEDEDGVTENVSTDDSEDEEGEDSEE